MTLCIAAPCKHESSPAIVLCADTRGTHGLVTSDDTHKFRIIGSYNHTVLIAGETTKADELVNECEIAIKTKINARVDPLEMDIHTTEILQLLRSAVQKRKKALVDEYLTLNIGMNMAEFLAVGKERFVKDHYDEVWDGIRRVNLGAEVIVPFLTEEEAVIFVVEADGRVVWVEHYAAIGTGAPIADIMLSQSDYEEENLDLMMCLYRVLEAKIAAERNPSVGPSTAFEIVTLDTSSNTGPLRYKRFNISDKCYKHLEGKVRGKKPPKLKFKPEFLESNDEEQNDSTAEKT